MNKSTRRKGKIVETTDRKTRSHNNTQVTRDATHLNDRPNKVSDVQLIFTDQSFAIATNDDPNLIPSTPLEQMIQNLSNKFDTFQANIKTIDDNILGLRNEMCESQVNNSKRLDNLTEQTICLKINSKVLLKGSKHWKTYILIHIYRAKKNKQ